MIWYIKIRNGCNGDLKSSLCSMAYSNINMGMLHETKKTEGFYTQWLAGYRVVASDVPS